MVLAVGGGSWPPYAIPIDMHDYSGEANLRWLYTPAIMIFMTFFLVKYLAKGAGTEAK